MSTEELSSLFFLKELYRKHLAFVRELRTQGNRSSRKSLNAKRSSEVYSSDGKSIQFIKAEEVRPSHSKKVLSKEANPGNCDTFTAKTFIFLLNRPPPPAPYFTPAYHAYSLVIVEWPHPCPPPPFTGNCEAATAVENKLSQLCAECWDVRRCMEAMHAASPIMLTSALPYCMIAKNMVSGF